MEQQFDIKADVKKILELCQQANPYGTKTQKAADEAFWAHIKTLDSKAKAGPGPVHPGLKRTFDRGRQKIMGRIVGEKHHHCFE